MTNLVSFDPGLTTGVAIGEYSIGDPYRVLETWEIDGGLDGFIKFWPTLISKYWIDIIVSESFTLNMGNEFAAEVEPLRIEGALTTLAALYGQLSAPIIWQARSAKVGVPDALLRSHGLWDGVPGQGHARDAVRHALEWLRRSEHMPTLRHYFKED